MKVCVLYSGGKDSNLALLKASKYFEVSCLVSIIPKTEESYLFHKPNAELTKLQAKALEIPIIQKFSEDDEENQMETLKEALEEAKRKFKIEGVVTGAIRSTYQGSRFQKVCKDLKLWCFNPLWLRDEVSIIREILNLKFEVIVTRLSAYPFEEKFLGRKIDEKFLDYLIKNKMNPAGEGGEYETFVLWMPLFKKRIKILKAKRIIKEFEGNFIIEEATLA